MDVSIAKEDQEKVKTQRFEHPDVHVQRRLHILYFKSLGYAHKDICLLAGVSYTTIETVLKLYQEQGLEEVCNVTYPYPGSALDPHRVTIEEYFRKNPPATVAEACKVIKDLTGVYIADRAAHMLGIELLYLPPYSPNLNLIERAWKFIKKKALADRSFGSFQLFQEAIRDCIEKFSTVYRPELKTLMT